MATFEDKILGNRLENYCSSSEDEEFDDARSSNNDEEDSSAAAATNMKMQKSSVSKDMTYADVETWSGSAANTGPKGVIRDWQRFKQLENENNSEKELERLNLMKKLCVTTSTKQEDEQRAKDEELDIELEELLNDSSLLEFQKQRMLEMLQMCADKRKIFGKVQPLLSGDEFITAVDGEHKHVTIIIHIYDNNYPACKTMNKCLDTLAQEYVNVKFCKILHSIAGMSKHFKLNGIPAILIYKAGNLIGNFVKISDELGGDDFFSSDLEGFLIENGLLPDKSQIPTIVNSD